MGERGPMGVMGLPGKDAAASGYRPLFWAACGRTLDLVIADGSQGSDGILETLLNYSWILFSNHDVEVSCVASAGIQDGSNSEYYPATVVGAQQGGCIGSVDYPPSPVGGAAGYWNFTTSGPVLSRAPGPNGPQAQYKDDASHWLNGRIVVFAENDCHVQRMDASGIWTDAALSDAF